MCVGARVARTRVRKWWMCAEKRILLSSVERTRASSCQRTPPRIPPRNQPLLPWRTPTPNPCFAFPRPRFPLYPPLRSLSLALFPRRPVQPSVSLRAKPRRRKPNETGGKTRITQEPRFNEWWRNFAGLEIWNLITYFIILSLYVVLVSRILEFIERENLFCRWNVL